MLENGDLLDEEMESVPEADVFSVVVAGFAKEDRVGVELLKALKGDCSDPANEANFDAPNAEDEAGCSLVSLLSDVLEPPNEAKGETAEVFIKLFGKEDYLVITSVWDMEVM